MTYRGGIATESGLLLSEEQVAEIIKPAVAPYVWTAESAPWLNEQKHEWVRRSVMSASPLLKHSVKELRGVPDELLVLGVDLAIRGLCMLLKEIFD